MADIRDFILTEETEPERYEAKPKKKAEINYEILASNDMDFVIQKKGKRSKAIMAIIPSKGQFYINNMIKDGTAEKPASMEFSSENIKKFLYGLEDPFEVPVEWIHYLEKGKDFSEKFARFIKENGEKIKLGIITYESRNTDLLYIHEHSPALANFLVKTKRNVPKVSPIRQRYNEYQPCACGAFEDNSYGIKYLTIMEKVFGLDSTKNFVNAFVERDINFSCDSRTFAALLSGFYSAYGIDDFIDNYYNYAYRDSDYNINEKYLGRNAVRIDIKSLTEYALTYQREGFDSLRNFFQMLADDWRMQGQLSGTIKEKYPKNLSTHHGQINVKNMFVSAEIDKEKFNAYYNRQKGLSWSNKDYIIKVPESVDEMIDEAIQQDNCLRSYINRVMDGQTNIVFLRKKAAPDKSLVTIEVKDNTVVQVKAKFNKNPQHKEMDAIHEWAKAKKIHA
jgi:hypothetical protein